MSLADAYVEVKPDTKNFGPLLKRDLSGVDTTGPGVQAGNRFVTGFGRGLRTLGAVGVRAVAGLSVALGTAAVAAGGLGLKTAAANENAMIAFTTMLKSGSKAQAFIKELQQFAATTPFDFGGLQQAASSLLSIGIQANKIIPIMTTLGDVTAGMGTGSEGIKRATIALQQMNAAGRITAEDLNQLRDAGVPVFDLLTAATGKTKAQIADMASKGKLGRQELEQLMKALETGKGLERFNGLMDKQSQSLQGLWSTLKDTFSQGMATAIAPSLPLIKEGLGGAIEFVSAAMPRFAERLKGATDTVTQFVHGITMDDPSIGRPLTDLENKGWKARMMFIRLKSAAQGLWDLIVHGDFTGQLSSAFGWAEDSAPVDFILDLRDGIGGLVEKMRGAGGDGGAASFGDVLQRIGDLVLELLEALPSLEPTISATSTIFGFLADHVDDLSEALPYLIGAFVAFKAAQAANNAVGANSIIGFTAQLAMMAAQTAAQFTLAAAIRASTTATVQNTGAQVSGTLTANLGVVARTRAAASMVAHRVATIASTIATRAHAAATALANFATNGTMIASARATAAMVAHRVVTMAVRGATMAWTAVQWLLNAALTANPVGLVVAAIAALVGIVVLAYQKNETFRKVVQAAWKGIQQAIGAVVDWWTGTAWPAIKRVLDHLGDQLTWLWEHVARPVFRAVSRGFSDVGKGFSAVWDNVIRPAFSFITRGFLTVAETIIKGAAKAFGWVPGLGPKLKTAASKFGEFKDSVNRSLNRLDDKDITVSAKFRATYGLQAGGAKVTKETRGLKQGGPVPHLPGSVPHQDSVSALLVPGEFVVREDGSNLSDAISHYAKKNGRKYRDGGLVLKTSLPSAAQTERLVSQMKDAMSGDVAPYLARLAQQRLDRELAALAAQGGATYGAGGGNTLARVRGLLIPGAVITSTYRSPEHNRRVGGSPTSKHMDARNPAVDIGGPTRVLDRLYPILRRADHWRQLFWRVPGHYDHIHVADRGAMIKSGSLGLNLSGRPERMLSPEQTQSFERLVSLLEGSGGVGGPRTLVVVDEDGALIGRMRVEAGNVFDEELANARWGAD